MKVSLKVNGAERSADVEPRTLLVELLRELRRPPHADAGRTD